MTRNEHLRRVLIVCCHFARNYAYHLAGWKDKKPLRRSEYWVTVNGNFIDIAVLEWCKLFGGARDAHSWKAVVTDAAAFEKGLLSALGPGMPANGLEQYVTYVRKYRDKFVAHLDHELVADIPALNDAWTAVRYYYQYVLDHEAEQLQLGRLPSKLATYYERCFDEAKSEYHSPKT